MPWMRVDDDLWGHPKFIQCSFAARGLWVTAGSYCMKYLTEGFVALPSLTFLGLHDLSLADELVAAGLWDEAEGGYQFRDWADYQKSKEAVEAERERWRSNKAKARTSTRVSTVDSTEDSPGSPAYRGNGNGNGNGTSLIREEAFDRFWKAYPKHGGSKKATLLNWQKAMKKGVDPERVVAAATAYSEWLSNHPDPPKVKYAQGWLTEERWEVELPPYPTERKGTYSQQRQGEVESLVARYRMKEQAQERRELEA